MRSSLAVAGLVGLMVGALVLAAGCEQANAPAPAAPGAKAVAKATDGWTVVYTSDFKGSGKLPAGWEVPEGEAKIEGGALVLKAPADSEGQVVLLEPRSPGSVRLECVASLKGDALSDISPFINGDASGFQAGYLFQFGGKANTVNDLCRYGDHIAATETDKPAIKGGQKYRIVAENDGGRLRFAIDGQEVFKYTDPEPLKGQGHDRVGFYTWGCTLTVEKLTVSTKPAATAAK